MDEEKRSHAEKLSNLYETYTKKHEFKVGDMIEWKEGMKNLIYPEYRNPIIVTEFIDPPMNETSKGIFAPGVMEPFDIRCSYIDSAGDFETNLFSSHRFKPFEG